MRIFDTVCNLSEAVKQKQQRELAEEMLKDGEEFEKVKKYTHLSEEFLKKWLPHYEAQKGGS